MQTIHTYGVVVMLCILIGIHQPVLADETAAPTTGSVHLGLVHPEGVDFAGYSAEKHFNGNVYSFYTFGFPALAATGFTYYGQYSGNGISATAGVGLGFVLYGSVAYQFRLSQQDFLKLGAGWGAGISYSGGYPVLSYEHRFAH